MTRKNDVVTIERGLWIKLLPNGKTTREIIHVKRYEEIAGFGPPRRITLTVARGE